MNDIRRVGIVGAGISGLALATLLAEKGFDVEVLERAPALSPLGSGITLQGNLLRVFRDDLGIWDDIKDDGYAFNDIAIRIPDPDNTVVAEIPDVRSGGPQLPATLGLSRPQLAEAMRARAEQAGARVRFGTSVTGLDQDEDQVTVHTQAGDDLSYDLLVGADGLHSVVRQAIGIDQEPQRLGMGIWRAFVPRPAQVSRTELTYGGPAYIAGYCPTSDEDMYAYIVEPARSLTEEERNRGAELMHELAVRYGGPWREIAPTIAGDVSVNYSYFSHHVVDGPWHVGRVVLVGDAVHSCPPTIAQGAAMAAEDAVVLARRLTGGQDLEPALAAYREDRLPRVVPVREGSVQIAHWVLAGEQQPDIPGVVARVMAVVSEPV